MSETTGPSTSSGSEATSSGSEATSSGSADSPGSEATSAGTERSAGTNFGSPGTTEPLRPRVGTIVWGAILLVIAAIAIIASRSDFGGLTPALVVWGLVGLGAAIVLGAIAAAAVRAARKA